MDVDAPDRQGWRRRATAARQCAVRIFVVLRPFLTLALLYGALILASVALTLAMDVALDSLHDRFFCRCASSP